MSARDRRDWLLDRLRRGGPHRAEDLAREIGVTPRTIYRDMALLRSAGLPVAGERGVGYAATAALTLPPLALGAEEAAALTTALSRLAATGEPLSRAAAGLLARIEAPGSRTGDRRGLGHAARALPHLGPVAAAIHAGQKLRVTIGDATTVLRPLAVDHWAGLWTLVAWSETEDGFRDLPLHRVDGLSVLPELFFAEPGKRLEDRRLAPGKDEAAVAADHQP